MLEVGDQDRVGITVAKTGDYQFPYKLPENEWVHLAFVAAAPPRRKVQLFVNGDPQGSIDGVTLSLPMQYFGGPDRAFCGCIQDVSGHLRDVSHIH